MGKRLVWALLELGIRVLWWIFDVDLLVVKSYYFGELFSCGWSYLLLGAVPNW
jgi:hypothetical protein